MNHPEQNTDTWPSWATETVTILPSDPGWPDKAAQQRQQLLPILQPFGVKTIEHIGSTAVPDLPAKPILDLAAAIPSFDQIDAIAELLRPQDWHYVPIGLDKRPDRRFFIKVVDNKRAVHLHFMIAGSHSLQEHISFRDLLIKNPSLKNKYARLKMDLAQQHHNDREAYTDAKAGFIKQALATATASSSAANPNPAATPSALAIPSPMSTPQKLRIIFATNNAHKVEEVQAAIGSILEVVSLRKAGIDIDIPEPHDTLEANATEKSTTIHRLTGDSCFSEDTGLEVAALNGEPGVKSARYAGEDRSFENNVDKLLHKLGDNAHRQARFRTVISLIWNGTEHLFEGICNGRILTSPTGTGGFGYDPIFAPDGDTRSFAQMSMEEKNQYSHRRKAADQLVAFLQNHAAAPAGAPIIDNNNNPH